MVAPQAGREAGLAPGAPSSHTLKLPVALLNLQGLFFSSVLLNEESNNPHFNYTGSGYNSSGFIQVVENDGAGD